MGQASLPVIDARSATVTKGPSSAGHARELISKLGRNFSEFLERKRKQERRADLRRSLL